MDSNSNDVMFLFGAGISIPIGIPAMEGTYNAYINSTRPKLSAKHKKICDLFTKEMGVSKDLEEFLLAANNIIDFQDSKLNRFVEKNISRSKSSLKISDFNKNLKVNIIDIIEVRNGILDFLSNTCFKFDREECIKINLGFVETLSKLGHPVYSTNYDYAFEHVAIEKGIKIIDNFIKTGQRNLWNENVDFEEVNGFKLIKLHGSVTWYSDNQGNIEKIYYNTNLNPQGDEVEKIVIVPTRFKDIYSQHFFALYSRFLNSLTQSKVIIIAGHSLRDDYLRAGIIERNRKGNFQIIIIDPNYPDIVKNELPPVRQGTVGRIIHLPYKWEEFSDELSFILLNSTPAQIASNCIKIFNKYKFQKNKIFIKGNIRELKVLQSKEISVETKAHLSLNQKPVNMRVWLSAEYTDTDGTKKNQVFNEFIEEKEIQFGNNLTSIIESTNKIKIKIPKIPKWLEVNCKVTLNVALVKSNITKPLLAKDQSLIVSCNKLLPYKN